MVRIRFKGQRFPQHTEIIFIGEEEETNNWSKVNSQSPRNLVGLTATTMEEQVCWIFLGRLLNWYR